VLAVVESCFDLWLLEAADEVEVFGLSFRRVDLPVPSRVELLASSARAGVATIPALPTQRRSPPEDGGGAPSAGPQRRASAGALDLRRRLARTIGRVGGGRHRQVATRD
jgi:hypothetical protein